MHATDRATPPQALLITGTVGSGKTSVADAVGDLLAVAEIPHAVIDLDWLCQSWPASPGDRFSLGIQLRNLRCVARNYLDAGAMRLVLAGVVESRADRQRYRETLGIDLVMCRLLVDLALVERRLRGRHDPDDPTLAWHLERAGDLDSILDRARVEDHMIPATYRSLREVAADVLEAVGWTGENPTADDAVG